jgi:toxin-antitoxin system PIN domain toxin
VVALLDVNVLVALFDPDHVHHEAAHRWFGTRRRQGWATCPLTENGAIRVLSHPSYSPVSESAAQLARRLSRFCASGGHTFWADDASLRDDRLFRLGAGATSRQLTDVYLLGLARQRGGRLATFDRGIPVHAVSDVEPDGLVVIPA